VVKVGWPLILMKGPKIVLWAGSTASDQRQPSRYLSSKYVTVSVITKVVETEPVEATGTTNGISTPNSSARGESY